MPQPRSQLPSANATDNDAALVKDGPLKATGPLAAKGSGGAVAAVAAALTAGGPNAPAR